MEKRNDESLEWTLIRKSLAEDLTKEEQEQLNAWLEASPEHRAFYNRISKFDRSEGIAGLSGETYQRDRNRYVDKFRQNKRKNSKRRLVYFTRYAAVFIMLLGVGLYFWYANGSREVMPENVLPVAVHGKAQPILVTGDGTRVNLAKESNLLKQLAGGVVSSGKDGIAYTESTNQGKKADHHTLIIPRGGEFRVELADGTVVWLNSESEFTYPVIFNDTTREVSLKGEAYFEVTKDKKPFKVSVNGVEVKVYGTRFNVNGYDPRQVQTVLVEGRVGVRSLEHASRERMMSPNEMAEVNTETGECVVTEVDASAYVAWKEGYFSFEGESLEQIMEKLGRWYDVEVVFAADEARSQRFSGRVDRSEDFRDVLNLLQRTLLVKFEVDGNKITITK